MAVFYNDIDDFACDWLNGLIASGAISPGVVCRRSITELHKSDVEGFEQCHFFAGLAGWAYALDLAGWRGPVWTGSVPCQPLSRAGKHHGHADERHLWPAFHALIDQCQPATIFGEQVAGERGREWLAGIRADLEALGYAVGCAGLPAAGVGSPQVRERLWWGAQRLGDTDRARCQEHRRRIAVSASRPSAERRSGSVWGGHFVRCDGADERRIEPGIFPLVDGFPNRVGALRCTGNAIVAQVGALFVSAFMEACA